MNVDPVVRADVAAQARSRTAHHEAGHAVAAVLRGGRLISISIADDLAADPDKIDSATPAGNTRHSSNFAAQPFVTFAGPWAEARWMLANPDFSRKVVIFGV